MKLNELSIGDTVIVASGWGYGPLHTGVVNDVLEEVKNGRPGIDYTRDNGNSHWAYLDQVIKKLAK